MSDSTIILNLRLRGGSFGSSSKGIGSFQDAVKGKGREKPSLNQHHYKIYLDPTLWSKNLRILY